MWPSHSVISGARIEGGAVSAATVARHATRPENFGGLVYRAKRASRPDAIGGDIGDALCIDSGMSAHRLDGDAVGVAGKSLDPRAEFQAHVGMLARGIKQRGIEIATVDDPERRAVALLRRRRRECGRFPPHSLRSSTRTPRRHHCHGAKPRAEAEFFEETGCIGGELDARADSSGRAA